MTNIFVVSASADVHKKIQSQLSGQKMWSESTKPRFRFGTPGKVHQELAEDTDVLIFESAVLGEQLKEFPISCRSLGYEGPIIVLCPSLPENMKSLRMDGVVYIDNPFEKKNLVGVVKNILEQVAMSQRQYRRFEIEEKVELEVYNGDLKCEALIRNISRGGLFLKGHFQGLKSGDLIKVHFDLDKIQKQRVMSARVAWVQSGSGDQDGVAAGVEFVSQMVVYDYLLKFAI